MNARVVDFLPLAAFEYPTIVNYYIGRVNFVYIINFVLETENATIFIVSVKLVKSALLT